MHYNSPRKLYYRLLSEFMLQQTQVKTVIPYFLKLLENGLILIPLQKQNYMRLIHIGQDLAIIVELKICMKQQK